MLSDDLRVVTPRRQEIFDRIMRKVEIDEVSGCWNWTGGTSGDGRGGGYGRMSLNGQTVATHKAMYVNVHGFVPGKKQIDHKCGNRLCVNPDHLEMVSHKENQRRRVSNQKLKEVMSDGKALAD